VRGTGYQLREPPPAPGAAPGSDPARDA